MNRTRQLIERRLRAELQRSARAAADDSRFDVEGSVKRLQGYQALLDRLPVPWYRRWGIPVVVCMLCVTGVWLAWFLPMGTVTVRLDLVTTGLNVELLQS